MARANDAAGAIAETCAPAVALKAGPERVLENFSGGSIWWMKLVRTSFGWGLFFQRAEPRSPNRIDLYYMKLSRAGRASGSPKKLLQLARIASRSRYYNAAWSGDHYGLIVADGTRLWYYDVARDGAVSNKHPVGPALFVSTTYSNEADSDLDAYPGGFVGVIEGDCSGHSCSYAFCLDAHGKPRSQSYNLVDYDVTHTFFPKAAYDEQAGFAIISVKDINIRTGGVGTRYLLTRFDSAGNFLGSGLTSRAKVMPLKEYLWDEQPDIAWNGTTFGAVWTEVTRRPPNGRSPQSWQMHFASFTRNANTSVLMTDRVFDIARNKNPYLWTTQIHGMKDGWLVQRTRAREQAAPEAVFSLLDQQGNELASIAPYEVTTDALSSSPLISGLRYLGVVRAAAAQADGTIALRFHSLRAYSTCPASEKHEAQ